MTTEERLAKIEANTDAVREAIAEIKTMLSGLANRVQTEENRRVQCQADTSSDIKLLKIGVSLALFATLGGGGAVVAKFFGL